MMIHRWFPYSKPGSLLKYREYLAKKHNIPESHILIDTGMETVRNGQVGLNATIIIIKE
jgi:hypothetical protein